MRLAHIYEIKMMLAGAKDLQRRRHLCRAKNAEQSITWEPPPPLQNFLAPSTPEENNCSRRASRGKAIKRFAYCEDNVQSLDFGLACTRGDDKNKQLYRLHLLCQLRPSKIDVFAQLDFISLCCNWHLGLLAQHLGNLFQSSHDTLNLISIPLA